MKVHPAAWAVLALVTSFSAQAQQAAPPPPPGHPSVEQMGQMLHVPQNPAALPYTGSVKEVIDTSMYTYVLVGMAKEERWLAIPRTDLKAGEVVRFGDGAVMNNFYSKTLQRTFPSIHFLGEVARDGAAAPAPVAAPMAAPAPVAAPAAAPAPVAAPAVPALAPVPAPIAAPAAPAPAAQ